MSKQTAVEWLYDNLKSHFEHDGDLLEVVQMSFEQAKEMEKERMINFTEDWYFNGPLLGEGIDVKNTIEQHFNKTYGGGNK